MRVLFVDDEANIRDVYRSLLELAGHVVVTADSAETAAWAIEHDRFDLAFIDVVLGGRDGFAVLEHLKRRQPFARAVVVTAHDRPDASDRARALAAEAFLAKPVRWADLQSFLGAPAEGVREI